MIIYDNDIERLSRCNENKSKHKQNISGSTFTIPFVSDSLNRKIKNTITKYKLDIKLVNNSSRKLKDNFQLKKRTVKHNKCEACECLPEKYDCNISNVVYEFICRKCGDNYIGKTSRTFRDRYLEHKRSIRNKDNKSALSVHVSACECESVADFDVRILECVKSALDIALLEARLIRRRRPVLNRCHELSEW